MSIWIGRGQARSRIVIRTSFAILMPSRLALYAVRCGGTVRPIRESLQPCESSQARKETSGSSATWPVAPIVFECHSSRNLALNRSQASDRSYLSARRAISSRLTLPDFQHCQNPRRKKPGIDLTTNVILQHHRLDAFDLLQAPVVSNKKSGPSLNCRRDLKRVGQPKRVASPDKRGSFRYRFTHGNQ